MRQELGDRNTTVVAEGADLLIERIFDAPRELVWTAMTSPEHIAQWWGPHGTTAEVLVNDLRPGGTWRWVNKFEGGEAPFRGEYLEVVPPERLVRTVIFDVEPSEDAQPAVETITFEDLGGRTRVRHEARFPSEAVLTFAVEQGMSKGVLEQFDKLADLLATLA